MYTIETTIGDADSRQEVSGYHSSPYPIDLSVGYAKKSDIKTIKGKDLSSLLLFDSGNVSANFTIGFEIEKNRFSRNSVKGYPLFKGFERDSSCGFEAITNILPLLPNSKWRMNVFNMMVEAERIIDDAHSPSDTRCGGHITLGSFEIQDGNELLERVRKYSGLFYAMFRYRLKNRYCYDNPFMLEQTYNRYQVCLAKAKTIEFRLPSRVTSVADMMTRYEICYLMMKYAHEGGSFNKFLKDARPIVIRSYNGDVNKAEEILNLAVHMQNYILGGEVSPEIQQFIN
jgi:hypothetical protein